jgi:hypothetical protein
VFQHNQFHLSAECLHLKSMMLPTGNKICLATRKNYSDIYRSGSLRMCERKHSCLYKTTEDVIRAGISLLELQLHVIYGITLNSNTEKMYREHQLASECYYSSMKSEPDEESKFIFKCNWPGCDIKTKPEVQIRSNVNSAIARMHRHIWTHSGRRLYACHCNRQYGSRVTFLRHLNQLPNFPNKKNINKCPKKKSVISRTKSEFVCNHCPYKTERQSDMTKHIRRMHDAKKGEKFSCPHLDCEFEYLRGENLQRHLDEVHSATDGYLCHCGFINKDVFGFRCHVRTVHNFHLARNVKYYETDLHTSIGTRRYRLLFKMSDVKEKEGKHFLKVESEEVEVHSTIMLFTKESLEVKENPESMDLAEDAL